MSKLVILLTDANAAPSIELIESLRSAGVSVLTKDLREMPAKAASTFSFITPETRQRPLAVLYEIQPKVNTEGLRLIVDSAMKVWPTVSIVACRHQPTKPDARRPVSPDNEILKRLGFRFVADSPAQLPALLRQAEDVIGTGESRLAREFRSTPDSHAFSLPASVRSRHLRGAFALLASLHLAADEKEAGQAAIAGVARLVSADRWTIFLIAQTNSAGVATLESLAGRVFPDPGALLFDEAWQCELIDDVEPPNEPASRAAHEAATRIAPVRKFDGRRVVALPLVSGERVLGVLEGVRSYKDARSFSRSETALLSALSIPIASALSNSVRIAEAELLSLTDDLTKLHNARYLRQFLVNEIKRARRYASNVAAVFLDLDDFKRINDLHGHLVGSHVLMEVAAVILPSVRDTDCFVRYGGDEFVAILPEAGVEAAFRVAERIRAKVERHQFTGGRRLKISLTASLGIAVFPEHALSPQQLISCADRAMYQAKAAHKNCVRVIAESERANREDGSSLIGPAQFQRIPGEKLIS